MRVRLYLLAVAGAAAGGVAVWLAAQVQPDRPTEPGPLLTFVVGASLLGSGLASWRARPDNRLGPIMVATAFAWFAGLHSEAPNSVIYTIGSAVEYVFVSGFIYRRAGRARFAKHSHASEVQVTATCAGGTLVVEVTDDGIGGATATGGSGLRGLADRIEALGGTMTVSSPPGRGTSLRAEVPCG